jgi:hypothetical protein
MVSTYDIKALFMKAIKEEMQEKKWPNYPTVRAQAYELVNSHLGTPCNYDFTNNAQLIYGKGVTNTRIYGKLVGVKVQIDDLNAWHGWGERVKKGFELRIDYGGQGGLKWHLNLRTGHSFENSTHFPFKTDEKEMNHVLAHL